MAMQRGIRKFLTFVLKQIKEFTLIVASWVIRARWREIRRFVLGVSTLLAEAFPLCFSALYCHSLRGFGCSRFVLLFRCRGKDLCRQPLAIPVEHARDENAVTMEFCHVSVIRCRRRSLLMYS